MLGEVGDKTPAFPFLFSVYLFMKSPVCLFAFLVFVPVFFFLSCGPDSHHGRIEGTIQGVNEANILVFSPLEADYDRGKMDTIKVKRGEFSYDREVEGPVILRLLYPNFSYTSFVMEPGKTVKLKGDGNRLKEITLDGNSDNLLLTEFRQRMLKLSESDMEREAATFVRSHPATLAAVTVFYDVFGEKQTLEPNPSKALLETLRKSQPENDIVKRLSDFMSPLLATSPGMKLPAFSATDLDGRSFTQNDLKGKPTLIVFCAQWQGSFFQIGRKAEALRQNFPESRFNMLFIVLDERESSLRKRLKSSPLPGRIVCDTKGMASPLVRKLGMRYVGGNILCDKDGTIIARDVEIEDWVENIPSFLKD